MQSNKYVCTLIPNFGYFSFAEYLLAQASYQCWQCNSVFMLIQHDKGPGDLVLLWLLNTHDSICSYFLAIVHIFSFWVPIQPLYPPWFLPMHDLHGQPDVYWVCKIIQYTAVFERPWSPMPSKKCFNGWYLSSVQEQCQVQKMEADITQQFSGVHWQFKVLQVNSCQDRGHHWLAAQDNVL